MRFGKRLLRRMGCGCLIFFGLIGLLLVLTGTGHTLRVLWDRGFFTAYVSPEDDRKYQATETGNLKSLYTAMMLYHESEGQWPQAAGWMDAIKNRVVSADLAKGEADKKFVSPSLSGKAGQFGYAMNDKASGKYRGEIKDPKVPLLFVSSNTSRNAHGDPKQLVPMPARPGGNLGITVDGSIVKL